MSLLDAYPVGARLYTGGKTYVKVARGAWLTEAAAALASIRQQAPAPADDSAACAAWFSIDPQPASGPQQLVCVRALPNAWGR